MNTWTTAPLGDLCKLVNGRAFKPTDWTKTGLPIVRIQNLNDSTKPFNRHSHPVSPKHQIDTGDILLSWSGTPGTSFGCFVWDRGAAILNQHIFRVHVNVARMLEKFFVYAVNSRLDEMIRLAHGGVGLRHITKRKLETIELPIPSINEQRRIITILDACMERIDEIRILSARVALETNALLPSLLSSTFTDLNAVYSSGTIGTCLVSSRYGTSRRCDASPAATPVLRIPNVVQGEVSCKNIKYCELGGRELERLRLEAGDILVVRTNGSRDMVGRCAVYNDGEQSFAFASYLIRLRVDTSLIDPHYLSFFLTSAIGRDAIARIRRTSAGQYNVNSENLRGIELPLPPLPIQKKVAERLARQRDAVKVITGNQMASSEGSNLLTNAVLRKAFAWEL